MQIIVAIIGAGASVAVAVLGAIYLNISNIQMQNRKLKEEHYINYITAIHLLAAKNTDKEMLKNYTLHRDKMFIIASEEVVRAITKYETEAVGKINDKHDLLLTQIYIAIRKDLRIKDKDYPTISLIKA